MTEYTNVMLPILIEGMDLTDCKVEVSIRKGPTPDNLVTLEATELRQVSEKKWIAVVSLSQEQSAGLNGFAQIQANVTDQSGYRAATNILHLYGKPNLVRKELPDE